ncbi:hypothetical protein D3C71_2105020 [compost metagenome]
MTAYREKSLQCVYLIREQGPLSPRKLRELTGNPLVSGLLQKNYYRWFVRQSRGIYALSQAGQQALDTYAEVVSTFKVLSSSQINS